MRISVFLTIVLICGNSCSGSGNDRSDSEGPESSIRVTNASPSVLDSVLVKFPRGVERYQNLAPGDTSEYRTVRTENFDPGVRVYIAGKGEGATTVISHYRGPAILNTGRYTCRIWIESVEGFGDDSFKVKHEFVREADI